MIDGPDPFEMGQKEWDTVQAHYLNFYYRWLYIELQLFNIDIILPVQTCN